MIATRRRSPSSSVGSAQACLPRQPPLTSIGLRSLSVVLSDAGESAGRTRTTARSTPPNAAPRNRQTTIRPRDPPIPPRGHGLQVQHQPTEAILRAPPPPVPRLSPPGRPGRTTAAVAAVRTTIDETNASHVPTRPIRRVPRPNSMVVLPYLPVPSPARSPQIRQTDRTAPLSFRQNKTRSSLCFVFRAPTTPGRPRKPERGPINGQ